MRRDIRFRGKCIQTGQWVYGCYNSVFIEETKRSHFIRVEKRYPGGFAYESYEVDPETVGQYTGLSDRNGKEIYEGDIVRYPDAYMNGVDGDWDEVTCVGEIKWDDDQAQFYVTNRESIDNEDFWEAIDEAEVIGNRWDNPDLLEG